jgi:MarR family 2-MHQ and catechol resistance regulon transcriptional repressor
MKDPKGPAMSDVVKDFLGAAHVFVSAVRRALEEDPLRDAAYGRLIPSQMQLLGLVELTGGLTVGGAAAFLKVSKAAASKTVDRLEKKMLLRRSPGERDRREIRLALTDAGRSLLSRHESERSQRLEEIFSLSSPGELRKVSSLLDCLSARIAIENFSAQPGEPCLQCGIYFRESCLLRTQLGLKCFHLSPKKGSSWDPIRR